MLTDATIYHDRILLKSKTILSNEAIGFLSFRAAVERSLEILVNAG